LQAAKKLISRTGTPEGTEIEPRSRAFLESLTWPGAQARRTKVRGLGYGKRTDLELNFGNALISLGS
jgi:hypothetical protein